MLLRESSSAVVTATPFENRIAGFPGAGLLFRPGVSDGEGIAMKSVIVLSAGLCVMVGCSQAHVPKKSQIAGGQEVVTCRSETPTGSHRRRTVCTSAGERAKKEAEGRAMVSEAARNRALEEQWRATATMRERNR